VHKLDGFIFEGLLPVGSLIETIRLSGCFFQFLFQTEFLFQKSKNTSVIPLLLNKMQIYFNAL